MPKLRSSEFAGKVVSLPHTEHGDPVRFNEDGIAEVSEVQAETVLYFFPHTVFPVEEARKTSKK